MREETDLVPLRSQSRGGRARHLYDKNERTNAVQAVRSSRLLASWSSLAYAIDPVVSEGAFLLRYEAAVRVPGIILSDEPHSLAVNFVRSNGSPALTGHRLVDTMPQSDLPSVEDASSPPGDRSFPWLNSRITRQSTPILGFAHAPL